MKRRCYLLSLSLSLFFSGLTDQYRAETEWRLNLAEQGFTHYHAVKDVTPNSYLR